MKRVIAWFFNSKFFYITFILIFLLATFFFNGIKASEPAQLKDFTRPYPIVDLSSNLQDRISQFRFGPTDASRIYAYTLLAADVAYKESNGDHQVIASAGAYVANNLVDAQPLKKEMDAFKLRHGVVFNSEDDLKGIKIGKSIIKLAEKDGYADYSKYSTPLKQEFTQLPKSLNWRPTGTGDGPLDKRYAELGTIIERSQNCFVNIPTSEQVERVGSEMFKNYKDTDAVGLDVLWWLAGTGTSTPSGYWLRIANFFIKDNAIDEKSASELIAKMAVAGFDAGVMVWKYKYGVNLLRPESLWIDKFGAKNNKLPRDTPNHPSFPSGHSGFSQAMAEIMMINFGPRPIRDQLPPDLYAKAWVRNWNSPQEAVNEASISRIHAGFHYPFDTEQGQVLGSCIGKRVNENYGELVKGLGK